MLSLFSLSFPPLRLMGKRARQRDTWNAFKPLAFPKGPPQAISRGCWHYWRKYLFSSHLLPAFYSSCSSSSLLSPSSCSIRPFAALFVSPSYICVFLFFPSQKPDLCPFFSFISTFMLSRCIWPHCRVIREDTRWRCSRVKAVSASWPNPPSPNSAPLIINDSNRLLWLHSGLLLLLVFHLQWVGWSGTWTGLLRLSGGVPRGSQSVSSHPIIMMSTSSCRVSLMCLMSHSASSTAA